MIPPAFPKKSPYIRIVKDRNDFQVDPFYRSLRSPTDQNSYILNEKLNHIKNWK